MSSESQKLRMSRLEAETGATPALVERGCVNVIGLEPIRQGAGAHWEKMRESVYAKLEIILRQKLGPTDFFNRLNDTSYLVNTPMSTPDEAQLRCLCAAQELYQNYLGRTNIGDVQIYALAQGNGDVAGMEPVGVEKLNLLAERAAVGNPPARAPENSPPPVEAKPEGGTFYIPVWDVKNEAITNFVCAPAIRAFRIMPGSPVESDQMPIKERLKMELQALFNGVAVLSDHVDRGQRILMTVPATFEMLGSAVGRAEFPAALRELPKDLRQYIVIEIVDVPPGVAQTRLSDLVLAVKPFTKAVIASVALGSRAYSSYQGIGLSAMSLHLWRQKWTEREVQDEISKLCAAAKRANLTTYAAGISTVEMLQAARSAGLHKMSGSAIAPPVSEPYPMRRLTWNDVMANAAHAKSAA